jgi:hypothetical protein
MNSPFQHRLNTNYVPSEEERHVIAQIVTEQDKHISHIDEEIHEHQENVKTLTKPYIA